MLESKESEHWSVEITACPLKRDEKRGCFLSRQRLRYFSYLSHSSSTLDFVISCRAMIDCSLLCTLSFLPAPAISRPRHSDCISSVPHLKFVNTISYKPLQTRISPYFSRMQLRKMMNW